MFCLHGHDTDVEGLYRGKCQGCRREAVRRSYHKNPIPRIAYAKAYRDLHGREKEYANNTAKRQLRKAELVKLMGGRCVRCGFNTAQEALDFDHIDPALKEVDIARALGFGSEQSFLKAKAEVLAKCQLLCANCHRIKTFAT